MTIDRIADRALVLCARALGALGILALLLLLTPLPNWLSSLLETAPRIAPADAVVVLGSNVDADGTLNGGSLRRAVHGMVLFRRGFAPRIVFTGFHAPGRASEAAVRAELAQTLGIPASALIVEERARTTREEAELVAARLSPLGAKRILLVTSSRHMGRAQAQFERRGFVVLPAPVQEGTTTSDVPEDRLELLRRTVAEGGALVYYRATGRGGAQ